MAQDDGFDPNSIKADKRAPQSIVKYGYGVLFLFSITSAVASWSSGRLASFIVIAVVIVGFLLALLAFDSMVRSKNVVWRFLGILFSTAALLGILTVFLAVLSFLLTGYPPALNAIFYPDQAKVDAVTGLTAEETDDHSVRVSWQGYKDPEAEVSLYPIRVDDPEKAPSATVARAGDGQATIAGLEPGARYRIRVEVRSHYRQGPVSELPVTTDARNLQVNAGEYEFSYTGKMSPDGLANDQMGTAVFDQTSQGVQWQFKGPFEEGRPNGQGVIRAVAFQCDGIGCGSLCQATMEKGVLKSAKCDLYMEDATVRAIASGSADSEGMMFDGASKYSGGIVGIVFEPSLSFGTVWVGPFATAFDGDGEFGNESTSTTIKGSWKKGALSGQATIVMGSIAKEWGEYESGRLKNGYKLRFYDSAQPLRDYSGYEYEDFIPQGAGIFFNKSSIGFGRANRDGNIEDGYWMGWNWSDPDKPVFDGEMRQGDGARNALSPTSDKSREECAFEEDLGLFPARQGWQYDGQWAMQCGRATGPGGSEVECNIYSKPESIYVIAKRRAGELPDIDIGLGYNPERNSSLQIGETVLDSGGKGRGLGSLAPISIAKLCTGETVINLNDKKSYSTAGFCRLAAVMFARLYSCI